MAKIKIIEKEVEIEGRIEKGKVTPFGTSAHIPFKKQHIGKIVGIVVPTKGKYTWLLSNKEREELLDSARRNIEKENGKLRHPRLQLLDDLGNEEFNLDSLTKILIFIDNVKIVKKIESLYNIKTGRPKESKIKLGEKP